MQAQSIIETQDLIKVYGTGEIAVRDIKSPRDLLVEDAPLTREKRDEAWAAVPPVYDYQTTAGRQAVDALEPTARNSNLAPVNANGEVRLRSVASRGSFGRESTTPTCRCRTFAPLRPFTLLRSSSPSRKISPCCASTRHARNYARFPWVPRRACW